jgi:hypothetical protein
VAGCRAAFDSEEKRRSFVLLDKEAPNAEVSSGPRKMKTNLAIFALAGALPGKY